MAHHCALVIVVIQGHCVISAMKVSMVTHQQSLACRVNAMETLIPLSRGPAMLPLGSVSSAQIMPQDDSVNSVWRVSMVTQQLRIVRVSVWVALLPSMCDTCSYIQVLYTCLWGRCMWVWYIVGPSCIHAYKCDRPREKEVYCVTLQVEKMAFEFCAISTQSYVVINCHTSMR